MTRSKKLKRSVIYLAVLAAALFWYLKFAEHRLTFEHTRVPTDFWGVTFSPKYARELGLDTRDAYLEILDGLGVRFVRLPVYWDDVETTPGAFTFDEYDWYLDEGSRRDVHFILAAGRRLPRWPECHQPAWTAGLSETEMNERHVNATKEVIRHFKRYDAVQYWQLENEYFFPWFGECPKANNAVITSEIEYLRSEDFRPLILTDSGELNSWRQASKLSDILGVTMYRVVWNNYFGYFRAPWPAWVYRLKAKIAGKSPEQMIVAELQAEPWPADFKNPIDVPEGEWTKSFNERQFATNAELARRTGFKQAYVWGVEWWLWLKHHGDPRMWNEARKIMGDADASRDEYMRR